MASLKREQSKAVLLLRNNSSADTTLSEVIRNGVDQNCVTFLSANHQKQKKKIFIVAIMAKDF